MFTNFWGKVNSALHSNKALKSFKHLFEGGHVMYFAAVFFEAHGSYALIGGGMAFLVVLNLWLHFSNEA